ncbi:phosphatase and actin regulator 2 [Trichonephila clavipes]|uniref:Phosphatase and actin regulator 2 n=1 Tax=Trichonephila clavipes TaxID=2585209 RepID=A0A8X6VVC0_TRICX|nr:phosphatase and actin regulator 2 [Trichonephila clavipes]
MYKNSLKEDLIRVVEDLHGTVESTDTIAKLKTKIENSSTFESDPDFVKTLIKNCIDERVSRNERDLEKQKIELAKLLRDIHPICCKIDGKLQYYCSLRKVNSFESLCDLIISDKLFETLNKETATHIGIREAEDWFRPIDLAKECDIYISSKNGSRAYAYPSAVSFSNLIENSSYDLSHVKNFNTRNDSSSLIKDYKCNKIKSTKLKLSIVREKCSDIVLCKKVNGAMKTSSVNFNTPSPMKTKHRRTLERKISMRSTKDQLVKKDVLMPDGTDRDQDSKINDSVHPTVLSSSQNHALPVKHNVFLWNLPDVEELPSHDGETV